MAFNITTTDGNVVDLAALNYTAEVPYPKNAPPTGGNSLTQDLNLYYNVRPLQHPSSSSSQVSQISNLVLP